MNIEIINLKFGNIASVKNMIRHIGLESRILDRPEDSLKPDWLILPGVGAFDHGMRQLRSSGFDRLILDSLDTCKVLGICLGMQMLCNRSEEGRENGLGLIPGEFSRFPDFKDSGSRVPHMGWNHVNFRTSSELPEVSLPKDPRFYFVHSYLFSDIGSPAVWATSNYGIPFASAIRKENIYGVQFHPEKSHQFGMAFFKSLFRC